MNPEIIALLNAKGLSTDHARGNPEITQEDVLFALSGANDGVFRLALYKICGRSEEARALYWALTQEMGLRNPIQKWIIKNPGWMEKLGSLAVREIIETSYCKPCGGTGRRPNAKKELITCTFCNGSGYKSFGNKRRAKGIGVKRNEWVKYSVVYNQIFDILMEWEWEIAKQLNRLR